MKNLFRSFIGDLSDNYAVLSKIVFFLSRTGVVYDERMKAHKERFGNHPECPERISCIWRALNEANIVSNCLRVPARDATMEEIVLVHRYAA